MADETAIFLTPWTGVGTEEDPNRPLLPDEFPFTDPDGVSRWEDKTGNYNPVSPNQYTLQVWCNTVTIDLIEADTRFTMAPGSWAELEGSV